MLEIDPGPYFEAAVESVVLVDDGARIFRANAAFGAFIGADRARLDGVPLTDLIHPDDAAALSAALRSADGGPVTAGLRHAGTPASNAVWRAVPAPCGGRFVTLRDVSLERRHREAVERLANTGSCETDVGGGRSEFSPVARKLFGCDPAALTREERMRFYVGGDHERVRDALADLETRGTPFDLKAAFRDFDGRDRWMHVAGAAELRNGRVERVRGTMRDVTEERERCRRLERLGAVARATSDSVVVTDRDLRIEWVNEAFTRQLGYAPEEVLGRGIGILKSPSDDPAVAGEIGRAIAEGRGLQVELANRHRDGQDVWLQMDLQPLVGEDGAPAGWIAIRRDITQSRETSARLERAEREARASREQLLMAVDVLDDGFVLYGPDDRMVACNERYRQLYAPSAHAMVPGAAFEEILRAGLERGQYLDALGREEAWLLQRLADHRAASRPVEQSLPDDRWLRIVERATPDGGRVGLRIDITELKRQQRDVEEARARAEAASEAKSRFLANMSHEIRTPMNGILGLMDLLAETTACPEQRRLVEDMQQAGETLLAILNDVLDVSKIEAGGMTLEAIAFDPAALARRLERLHGPCARDKGLELRIEVQEGAHRLGDPTRLLQVLGNLASNAIKFTERGSVAVRVRNPPDGPLVLEVEDTGIGMDEAETARAFDRFAQADGSVTRRFGGTGLGLSIVRGMVEAMGGRVEIASAPGRGTRVTATLSLEDCRPAEPASRGVAPGADLSGLSILAVDDSAANRMVLSRLLDRLGARSVIAASGAEAVAEAGTGRFDLLLLDISMPEMDGVEALTRIRADGRAAGRPAIPALAVTANAMEEQVAGYLAAGFEGHLAKPIRLATLAEGCRLVLMSAQDDLEPGRREEDRGSEERGRHLSPCATSTAREDPDRSGIPRGPGIRLGGLEGPQADRQRVRGV